MKVFQKLEKRSIKVKKKKRDYQKSIDSSIESKWNEKKKKKKKLFDHIREREIGK